MSFESDRVSAPEQMMRPGQRRAAAQPDAATDGIEPRLGIAQGRRAVRDVTRERAEPGGRLAEALDLKLRERRIRLGGRAELTIQYNNYQITGADTVGNLATLEPTRTADMSRAQRSGDHP